VTSIPGPAQLWAYALQERGIGGSQCHLEEGPLSLDEMARQYGELAFRQVGVIVLDTSR
jgi:hypothetical protein